MSLDQTIVRRLAFLKYLYQTAVNQSQAPAPLRCASLLTMHDAIELFLQLASDQLNAGSAKPDFMGYWDLLNPKLTPNELEQKESMRRLNKARVALKHHGTFPSDLDIESFRASTTNFFQSNTKLVFSLEFDEISLVEFVQPESSRQLLYEAQQLIQDYHQSDASTKIALAFSQMILDYKNRKMERGFDSLFDFVNEISLRVPRYIQDEEWGKALKCHAMTDFVKDVNDTLKSMGEALEILALGVDYRKYSKFKSMTPRAILLSGGRWVTRWTTIDNNPPEHQDARFCFDFAIETALRLAEFNYSINSSSPQEDQ
jgi:hypothetical protein